jgi:hypothetical protein
MKHAKITFTILPICLAGIIIKLFNIGDDSWIGIILFWIRIIISTMIVVPLMYCFVSTKYKIVNGTVRGILGTYLIMFLTTIMRALEHLFENSIIYHINNIINYILAMAVLAIFVFVDMIRATSYHIFTLSIITTFLLVDRFIMDSKYK